MSVAKKLANTAADRMATSLRRSPSFVHSTAIARRAAKEGDQAMVDAALRKAYDEVMAMAARGFGARG